MALAFAKQQSAIADRFLLWSAVGINGSFCVLNLLLIVFGLLTVTENKSDKVKRSFYNSESPELS